MGTYRSILRENSTTKVLLMMPYGVTCISELIESQVKSIIEPIFNPVQFVHQWQHLPIILKKITL